jgi:murein L,D-transpeptidase YafK
MKTISYILSFIFFSCISCSYAATFHNLPEDLLSRAVTNEVEYDSEFDYTKLGMTSDLIYRAFNSGDAQTTYSNHHGQKIVDLVVVNKAAHQMILMKDGQEVRKFWIALSDRPYGKKEYEGDKRTPEGTYTLDYIKQRSNYYKAFHISYPNAEDRENAQRLGRRPGGMIMIHGQPPTNKDTHETVQRSNWTNGCIALLNPDLDTFLSMVDVGTPITINP